jgi:glycerol-3-phosphate acyltransferase PlsX
LPTVALDLLGGDRAPDVVADAVALLQDDPEAPDLLLVGPVDHAVELLRERGIDPRGFVVEPATGAVGMDEDPLTVLRQNPEVSVSVAARLVARGRAQAWVSVGHTGAAVAAAVLELGRIPGMARPALSVVVPSLAGPVVLLDAGAAPDATPDLLRQFAVAGHTYAQVLGIADPGVGLLTIGSEEGKGDRLRRSAHELWAATRMGSAYGDPEPAWRVVTQTATSDFAGGMLLGVSGVTVVGHGAGTAEEICACVRLAARVCDMGLVSRTARAFSTEVR